jgi:STIP1 homology and U-box containing protein 1
MLNTALEERSKRLTAPLELP